MVITDSIFLLIESREHPMHVGALQLFDPPAGTGPEYVSEFYRDLHARDEVTRLFRRRAQRTVGSLGQWSWGEDPQFELDYHVRLSALPRPGKIRQLLELTSRLHGSLLDRHRPLWELHVIEGLQDGRFATYAKVHHALLDGMSMARQLAGQFSTDPAVRDIPPMWASRSRSATRSPDRGSSGLDWLRGAARLAGDLVGVGPAATRTVLQALRDSNATLPFQAPATMLNVPIGGARRCAGQSWPLQRVRAVGKAAGATVNDVTLAMSSGALRRYLTDLDALPDRSLVAMLPVSLRSRQSRNVATDGNALGAILCDLATDEADPALRLQRIATSTRTSKAALADLSPIQITVLSALVVAGLALGPLPGISHLTPPPFNLIISNVPGSRETVYWNGARLTGNYPLSIVLDGQALNITLTNYADNIEFGITGCRRSVPHLQRLLGHLDTELGELEKATA